MEKRFGKNAKKNCLLKKSNKINTFTITKAQKNIETIKIKKQVIVIAYK